MGCMEGRSQNAVDQSSAPHHQLVASTQVYHLPLALLFMAMPNFLLYLHPADVPSARGGAGG